MPGTPQPKKSAEGNASQANNRNGIAKGDPVSKERVDKTMPTETNKHGQPDSKEKPKIQPLNRTVVIHKPLSPISKDATTSKERPTPSGTPKNVTMKKVQPPPPSKTPTSSASNNKMTTTSRPNTPTVSSLSKEKQTTSIPITPEASVVCKKNAKARDLKDPRKKKDTKEKLSLTPQTTATSPALSTPASNARSPNPDDPDYMPTLQYRNLPPHDPKSKLNWVERHYLYRKEEMDALINLPPDETDDIDVRELPELVFAGGIADNRRIVYTTEKILNSFHPFDSIFVKNILAVLFVGLLFSWSAMLLQLSDLDPRIFEVRTSSTQCPAKNYTELKYSSTIYQLDYLHVGFAIRGVNFQYYYVGSFTLFMILLATWQPYFGPTTTMTACCVVCSGGMFLASTLQYDNFRMGLFLQIATSVLCALTAISQAIESCPEHLRILAMHCFVLSLHLGPLFGTLSAMVIPGPWSFVVLGSLWICLALFCKFVTVPSLHYFLDSRQIEFAQSQLEQTQKKYCNTQFEVELAIEDIAYYGRVQEPEFSVELVPRLSQYPKHIGNLLGLFLLASVYVVFRSVEKIENTFWSIIPVNSHFTYVFVVHAAGVTGLMASMFATRRSSRAQQISYSINVLIICELARVAITRFTHDYCLNSVTATGRMQLIAYLVTIVWSGAMDILICGVLTEYMEWIPRIGRVFYSALTVSLLLLFGTYLRRIAATFEEQHVVEEGDYYRFTLLFISAFIAKKVKHVVQPIVFFDDVVTLHNKHKPSEKHMPGIHDHVRDLERLRTSPR